MRTIQTLTAALMLLLLTQTAFSQSLGELARKEEERRKTIGTRSKAYSNDDLKRAPGASIPAANPPSTPSPAATTATPNASSVAAPGAQAKDPVFWKNRMMQAREQVERSKTLRDALQSRVNALNADFVNVDDPAQRAVIERDRQRALAEMARLSTAIEAETKAIATIEDEARRANIPAGWLR